MHGNFRKLQQKLKNAAKAHKTVRKLKKKRKKRNGNNKTQLK